MDEVMAHEAAVDRKARRWCLELTAELVEDRARTPPGMGPAQDDDASFDLRCHLVRTAIGLGAAIGQSRKALGGIAHESAVKGPAVDAVADGGVFDRRPVEHLSDRVVALLNHRKIHQWHGILLGSAEHK